MFAVRSDHSQPQLSPFHPLFKSPDAGRQRPSGQAGGAKDEADQWQQFLLSAHDASLNMVVAGPGGDGPRLADVQHQTAGNSGIKSVAAIFKNCHCGGGGKPVRG